MGRCCVGLSCRGACCIGASWVGDCCVGDCGAGAGGIEPEPADISPTPGELPVLLCPGFIDSPAFAGCSSDRSEPALTGGWFSSGIGTGLAEHGPTVLFALRR